MACEALQTLVPASESIPSHSRDIGILSLAKVFPTWGFCARCSFFQECSCQPKNAGSSCSFYSDLSLNLTQDRPSLTPLHRVPITLFSFSWHPMLSKVIMFVHISIVNVNIISPLKFKFNRAGILSSSTLYPQNLKKYLAHKSSINIWKIIV